METESSWNACYNVNQIFYLYIMHLSIILVFRTDVATTHYNNKLRNWYTASQRSEMVVIGALQYNTGSGPGVHCGGGGPFGGPYCEECKHMTGPNGEDGPHLNHPDPWMRRKRHNMDQMLSKSPG